MSKKDYQAIAAVMYQNGHGLTADQERLWVDVKNNLGDVFKADNPRFSRERFNEACETGKCRGMRQVA